MGLVTFDSVLPFSESGYWAAAVICRTEQGNLHTGMMYFSDEDESAIVHLGWLDYMDNRWPWARLWAVPEVDPELLLFTAVICYEVWETFKKERQFPYALKFLGSTFDEDGRLELAPGASGLTCSTFLLAIFNAAGIELIDEASWPVRGDDDRRFLRFIKRYATPEHYEILEHEVDEGCRRVRPEETLGACAFEPPASFVEARSEGDNIISVLDNNPDLV